MRRTFKPFILITALFSLIAANPAYADSTTLPFNLNVYSQIIAAVGATGDAMVKLTNGMKHVIATGAEGYASLSARRERDRLVDLSARATNLASTKNVAVVSAIDEYLERKQPTLEDWESVKLHLRYVLGDIGTLLNDFREERSDLVLEPIYSEIISSFNSRVTILNRLSQLPPPTTKSERDALFEINRQYKRLIAESQENINQLNTYISKKNS